MPVQSNIGRRSAVLRETPHIMNWPGHDGYYMRRMKEILQVHSVPPPTSSSYIVLTKSQQQPGVVVHAGPPVLPVCLLDHVYMGSQRNADDVELLKRYGITHVLNCAGLRRYDFTRSPYPKEAGIKGFLMISAEDHEDYDIKMYFHEAIAFLDDVKKCNGRALVHCNLGVNRSGAIAAAYLMESQRCTLLDVISYLKLKRFVVLSNKGFRRQLIWFARERGLLDPMESGSPDTPAVNTGDVQSRINVESAHTDQPRKLPPTSRPPTGLRVVDGFQQQALKQETEAAPISSNNLAALPAGDHTRNVLSPVYETAARVVVNYDDPDNHVDAGDSTKARSLSISSSSSSRSSTVLSSFLTLLGGRKPFRSTSFSNMASSFSESTSSISAPNTTTCTLSTSRPLRFYTRSSTDTELYVSSTARGSVRSAPARRCQ